MIRRQRKYLLLLAPVLFLIYSAPGALDYIFYHPDEKYYTDSVLKMIETEDCVTPYNADGSPRFLKPIVTYWVLMGSYKVFGISPFSSRLFFWLAGALLMLIVFRFSLSVSGNNTTALTASVLTASNPLVLLSASRSIPDIFLVLFLTLSAWGFVEIMLRDKPGKRFYWMAYMGAALAFETKGIPAAAFAGISILFLLFNPWKRCSLRKLFEPFSLFFSIAVALAWFVLMYAIHGSVYLDSFFADQVGERVSTTFATVLKNGLLGIITLAVFLLPWLLIPISEIKHSKNIIKNLSAEQRAFSGFALIWIILILVMSSAVFKFYDRYLLPVIPISSILFALFLSKADYKIRKGILLFFTGLNLLVLFVSGALILFVLSKPLWIAGILFCLLLLIGYFKGIFSKINPDVLIANGLMLFYFNVFILLSALLTPNLGEQLAAQLNRQNCKPTDEVYVYGNIRVASYIRMHSHNSLNVISMDTLYRLPDSPHHYLVFNMQEKEKLDLENYKVVYGSEEWKNMSAARFPDFLQPGVVKLKNGGTKYSIAYPKTIIK